MITLVPFSGILAFILLILIWWNIGTAGLFVAVVILTLLALSGR